MTTPLDSPESILCLRCGATPGTMCRTKSGERARYWHGRRNDDFNLVTGRDIWGRLPTPDNEAAS